MHCVVGEAAGPHVRSFMYDVMQSLGKTINKIRHYRRMGSGKAALQRQVFEQVLQREQAVNPVDRCLGKEFSRHRNGLCKGPVADVCLIHFREGQEASGAG